MRRWEVRFLGDREYGYESWEDAGNADDHPVVEAVDASSAARKVVADWRRRDAESVRDEGWYGDTLKVGVQEVVDPPPVRTFVRENGRMKLERL